MATGTPRNKVALKQGFSLVGWIRLANSGEDLTGTGGKRFAVSLEELSKHNTQEDCYMAIRGKVYNVTRYLEYHPGGVEQLMRGAGKDATSLFDEFHAWVNIDQLLAKCYIGPLKANFLNFNLADIDEKKSSSSFLLPPPPSTTAASSSKEMKAPMIPRFDWIQKQGDLSIYFYTKSFANPGILIEHNCDNECRVTIFIEQSHHSYKFSFHKSLRWPPLVKINQETGKVEISFEKVEKELWSSYGMHEKMSADDAVADDVECSIVEKEFLNHNTVKLTLRPNKHMIKTSVGNHVSFKENVLGHEVVRSYTPVLAKYLAREQNPLEVNFLIKKYEAGVLSKYITEKSVGDTLHLSYQKGSFEMSRLKTHKNVAIFAAGSGITPFCSGLIDCLLERTSNRVTNLLLFYFNKTEEDIWCRDIFDGIASKDERFKVRYILSEASEGWKGGESGRISEKFLDEILKFNVTIGLICGTIKFNAEAIRILGAASSIEAVCFQG